LVSVVSRTDWKKFAIACIASLQAFIDASPQHSVAAIANLPGLIVLRSLGKFFGFAGARVGYAFCAEEMAECLHTAIGPWRFQALRSQWPPPR
jgi:histidinol-phosphate/aromatic aminotransferase/cobyric acid decarboxylase-like protein